MADLMLICEQCGHRMRIPEYALGAMGRCAGCDNPLRVTEENTRPLEAPPAPRGPAPTRETRAKTGVIDGFLAPDSQDVMVRPANTLCARCQRPFRGDWDRYTTEQGVLCHICAHLISNDPGQPGPQTRRFDEKPAEEGSYFPVDPPAPPPDGVPAFARNHPVLFRRCLWTAALFFVALAIFFSLVDTGPTSQEIAAYAPEDSAERIENMSRVAQVIGVAGMHIVRSFCIFLSIIITLYVTLQVEGRLGESIWGNIAFVLLPAMALATPPMIAYVFPFSLIFLLMGFLSLLLTFWVLWSVFDLGFRGIVTFIIFSWLASTLAGVVSMFLLGLIGMALG